MICGVLFLETCQTGMNLVENLVGSQISDRSHEASCTKDTSHGASDLGGDTKSRSPIPIEKDHTFYLFTVDKIQEEFGGS